MKPSKYRAIRDWRCLDCGAQTEGAKICPSCKSKNVSSFDSRAEARHYDELRLRQSAREISSLEAHPRYPLYKQGIKLCNYVADFSYIDKDKRLHVIDVKGGSATDTPLSKHKRRHLKAQTGIDVEIVRK